MAKGLNLKMTGDWQRAGIQIKRIATNLNPAFKARLFEDGKLVLETLQGHIDNQDLPWAPLAKRTVELKGGDKTIYVETGELHDGMEVQVIESSFKGVTLFIGASPSKVHSESGERFSDLMIWLEYGTDKMPARPLIQPTSDEMQDIIKRNWKTTLKNLVFGR